MEPKKPFRLTKEIEKSVPPDEKVLWTGRPNWLSLAYRAYGLKYFWIYLIITGLYAATTIEADLSLIVLLKKFIPFLVSGTCAALILTALAFFTASHTCYVLTERRVVIQTGIALVFLVNMPIKKITSVDRQILLKGCGNISFSSETGKRIPYISCWPSVRPGYFSRPKPSFRSIENVYTVEEILTSVVKTNSQPTKTFTHESGKRAPV
jgi:hypothetical protein